MASTTCLDPSRAWTLAAVAKLNADLQRSADTHLIPLDLPAFPKVHLYLKDESVHPSGSLKHRLARSLYNYALVNGWIGEGCTVIENSSGSTAVSEAYFAKLLGLKFIAVCPKTVSPQKIALIQRYGGEVHLAESAAVCEAECKALAASLAPHSHFMDRALPLLGAHPRLACAAPEAPLTHPPPFPNPFPTPSAHTTRRRRRRVYLRRARHRLQGAQHHCRDAV
jgi:hypothetical protein